MRQAVHRPAEILLVEDNPADARLLRELFKDARLRNALHHVEDAETALAYLRREGAWDGHRMPDLVLLDARLPGMQGPELVEHIRRDVSMAGIPVVLLAPTDLHAERLRDSGVDAHCCLLKPIRLASFLEVTARIAGLGLVLMADDEAA